MTDIGKTKSLFHLPAGQIYLDGNSLGPLPKAAVARVGKMMREEWGDLLIAAWNRAEGYLPTRHGALALLVLHPQDDGEYERGGERADRCGRGQHSAGGCGDGQATE